MVSYVGFKTQEVNVGNQSVLVIRMEDDNQLLDEVVVIGYGTMKKRDLTGSITSVKADDIVRLEVLELGSPEGFARSTHCDYQFARIESYIGIAEKLPLELSYPQSLVLREPLGVVACITPWNYPLGQVVQKVIPAVLMGNAVVLKPSQHTPLTAHLLMEAFAEAGFPKGVVNLVCGRGSVLGEALVRSPDVSMVSFTGSTRVGAASGSKACRTTSPPRGSSSIPCFLIRGRPARRSRASSCRAPCSPRSRRC